MRRAISGITVSVEYDDLLAITLARNAKLLKRVVVVTSPDDHRTLAVVARVPNACVYVTDAFYRDGAAFNKGRAIEEGLGFLGRSGWILSFDADIALPPNFPPERRLRTDTLYAPWRRILADIGRHERYAHPASWQTLPRYEETWEFAGACLLFNAAAPHLGPPPWFGITWEAAQGYDTEFFFRWPKDKRVRWDLDVLHLGPHTQNWYGRRTRRLDGTLPEGHEDRARKMDALKVKRQLTRAQWPYPQEHIKCESS